HELYRFFSPDPPFALQGDVRLDRKDLKSILAARHRGDTVMGIWDRRLSAGMATEVWLGSASGITRRLVHPQTGDDLGAAEPLSLLVLGTLRHAHKVLLSGSLGWLVNVVGALSLVVLSISGLAMRWRPKTISSCEAKRTSAAFAYHSIAGAW